MLLYLCKRRIGNIFNVCLTIRISKKTNALYNSLISKGRKSNIFLAVIHPNGCRPGEPAEILGLRFADDENLDAPRLCFRVVYPDGVVKNLPLQEKNCYQFISEEDVRECRYPRLMTPEMMKPIHHFKD